MLHGLYRWMLARTSELHNERGATAVEYGLMVAVIAAVIVLTVVALGDELNTAFNFVLTQIGLATP
jgi:pilus assembly protein Flp/PilA